VKISIEFIKLLRIDYRTEWENITLEAYLQNYGGLRIWRAINQAIPKESSWKTIADILFASSMYECYNYEF